MEPIYTPAELAELHAYAGPLYISFGVNLVVWPLLLGLFAWRFSRLFPSTLWQQPWWRSSLTFCLCYFLSLALLYLPLDIWLEYVREREYGLATQSLPAFLWDTVKRWLVTIASVAALAVGVFGVARKTRHWWWLVAVASSLALVVSAAVDPYRSALFVEHTPLEPGALRTRLEAVLARASVEFQEIRVVHTSVKSVRVEAAFAGTGPTRTILLTDTLLKHMTEEEVGAAVAHEAGHVHQPRGYARALSVLALFALLAFWEWLFRRAAARRWYGTEARGDVRVLPVLMLAFTLVLRVATPVAEARSRQREYDADAYAVKLLGDTASLRSLLVKLARINKTDPSPPRWYVLAGGASHPPMNERLAALTGEASPSPGTSRDGDAR